MIGTTSTRTFGSVCRTRSTACDTAGTLVTIDPKFADPSQTTFIVNDRTKIVFAAGWCDDCTEEPAKLSDLKNGVLLYLWGPGATATVGSKKIPIAYKVTIDYVPVPKK